jgi:DNA repair protein RecO (recombination protein O)
MVSRPPVLLEAYVLHRYPWSESSLVLDVFTREQGRLVLIAKGAKRPYSQMRSVLLPFQRLNLTLTKKSTEPTKQGAADLIFEPALPEMQTLRAAQWAGGQAMLTGAALFNGFYLNELLMKLLARQDPYPALFEVYALTVSGLCHASESQAQAILRAFELVLLSRMGVLPDLCIATFTQEVVEPTSHYTLSAQAGVMLAEPGQESFSGTLLIALQAALQHGTLLALQQVCAGALLALRISLRAILAHYLGSNTLRTRELMREVQSL